MKTLIFDGSHAGDPLPAKISAALQRRLPDSEVIVLRQQKIGNCAGDFFCWVRSPGLCNTNDDNRLLAARVMHSDLLVYLTPVTFGGYASSLKRMVDHQIQNILPFFASVNGEIHHQPRYRRYPNLLVIGWMPASTEHLASTEHSAPDPQAEAIFRHLVIPQRHQPVRPKIGIRRAGWRAVRKGAVRSSWPVAGSPGKPGRPACTGPA